ncbi:MAG: hypothetical protein ACK53Y_00280, partial [bacterium]
LLLHWIINPSLLFTYQLFFYDLDITSNIMSVTTHLQTKRLLETQNHPSTQFTLNVSTNFLSDVLDLSNMNTSTS